MLDRTGWLLVGILSVVLTTMLASCQAEPASQATASPTALSQASAVSVTSRPSAEPTRLPTIASQLPTAEPKASTPTPTAPAIVSSAPSATATSASPAESGDLSSLALAFKPDRSLPHLGGPGDLAIMPYRQGVPMAAVSALLSPVPKSNRLLMVASTEGLEQVLDSLPVEISYIGYDLERWEWTPVWEQEHPVEAAQKLQEIAHARGLKVLLIPTIPYNEKYGTQLVPYADIYAPQAKSYQASLPPDEFKGVVRETMQSLKQANPNAKIFLDLAAYPRGIRKAPSELLDVAIGVRDLIDGIVLFYRPNEVEDVREFFRLLGR